MVLRSLTALFAALVLPLVATAQPSLERGLYASAEHRSDALMFSDLDDDVVWVVGHRFSPGLDLALLGSHSTSNGGATFVEDGTVQSQNGNDQLNRLGVRAGLARPIGDRFVGAASVTVLAQSETQLRLETVAQDGGMVHRSRYSRESDRLIVAGAVEVQAPVRLLGPLATSPALGLGVAVEPWRDEQFVDSVPEPVRSDVTLSYGPYFRVPLRLALPRETSLTLDAEFGLDVTRGAQRPEGGRYGTLHIPRGSVRASFSF